MPIIRVDMMEGRTAEMKERFIAAVCEAAVKELNVRPEQVRVVLSEYPKTNWGIGNKSVAQIEREKNEA